MINKSRIDSLQILRGIAASFVVFFHSVDNVSRGKFEVNSFFLNNYSIFHVGAAGVDLFFCISGFIMIYIHREDFGRSKSSLKFMKKRIIRIVPVYWILTTLALVILIFMPKLSYHKRELEWGWIALSYIFIPCINKSGNGYPVLGLGWTLNFEMYFYICFAICLFFKKRYFITLISVYFIFSITLGLIIKFFHPFMLMTTSPMLIEFIFGCLIAEAYINNIKLQTYQSVILILISLFLLYYSSLFPENTRVGFSRVLLWGIPTSFLLSSFILSPTISGVKWSWIILMIGNASYSIYLIQVFTIPFIAKLLSQVGLSRINDSNILVMFTGTIIMGIIFHHLIENKIIEWFKSSSIYK